MEALAQQQHDMDLAPRDQAARAGAPAAAKTSNKADDLPGLTSAVAMDIHKVGGMCLSPTGGSGNNPRAHRVCM